KAGVTFYAKDLSNDDEPMQVAPVAHKVNGFGRPKAAFTIGGHDNQPPRPREGVIDDGGVSNRALRQEQLLLTTENATDHTVGYWQFEAKPDPYHDMTGHGHDIRLETIPTKGGTDPRAAALIDFCHVLLNSNEFLYVD